MTSPRLSLITSVLDSHEVVRRQLLYLERWLPRDCELVLIDDGSNPSLGNVCNSVDLSFQFTRSPTRDLRPWTQPRARNLGARVAAADRFLFFDIDHIVTPDIVDNALRFVGDLFRWVRLPGVLDQSALLTTDVQTLRSYGWGGESYGVHVNSFFICRRVFETLGGYSELFCERYGGDDIDFNQRYRQIVDTRNAMPDEVIGTGYVFPNPSGDKLKLFHDLQRNASTAS